MEKKNSSFNKPSKKENSKEIGFGNSAGGSFRMLNKDGSFNLRRSGYSFWKNLNLFHFLVDMKWGRFITLIFLAYLLVNVLFAILYYAIGIEHLAGVEGNTSLEKFWEAFFFSAQSLTTVGYGRISPVGFITSFIASVEAMIGLLGFAIITGLLYGKFSKADAKILFSEKAIIAPYKNINAFEFRIANQRVNQLLEVEVQVLMARNVMTNGKLQRSFLPLKLETTKINFFPLPWTIVHPIDEESPIYNVNEKEMNESEAEFIILVKAFDDTFSQNVFRRYSYKFDEIAWGYKFNIIFKAESDGVINLQINRFHEIEKVALN